MTHHEEGVADPQAAPACRTLWDCYVLAVDCNCNWRSFAHRASADIRFDVTFFHGHHRKRSRGRQPVGFVVSAGVVAKVARVAIQEGHGTEPWETGASQTWHYKRSFYCHLGTPLKNAGLLEQIFTNRYTGHKCSSRKIWLQRVEFTYLDPGYGPFPDPRGTTDCNRPIVWTYQRDTWESVHSDCASPRGSPRWHCGQPYQAAREYQAGRDGLVGKLTRFNVHPSIAIHLTNKSILCWLFLHVNSHGRI